MDNVHFDNLYNNTMPHISAASVPQFVKSDASLFKDDDEIRFSRSLNNCKVPQIRYATPERLLQRLTDLRFLSIDFLNTFLLTYRVFTTGIAVLEALKKVFFNPDQPTSPTSSCGSIDDTALARDGLGGPGTRSGSGQAASLHVATSETEGRRISTCSGYSTGPELMTNLSRWVSVYCCCHWYWHVYWGWGVRARGGSARRAPPAATAATTGTGRVWTAAAGASTGDTASENVSGVTSLQVNIVNLLPDEEERRESRDELGTRDSPVRVSVSISGAAAGASWRKESVTIVEGQEPGEDEEAGSGQARSLSVESGGSPVVSGARQQLLSIPSTTITNSSSAETLTDNTITGPDTPTSVTALAR